MNTHSRCLALLFAISACSSDPTGTLQIVLGGEADALTRAPAPNTLVVESIGLDGTTSKLSRTKLPAASIELPVLDQATVAQIRISAIDDAQVTRASGTTLPFQLGALQNSQLDVFVQRVGEFARMPSPFTAKFILPPATLLLGRYLFISNGFASQIYDLLGLYALSNPPTLPRAALTVVANGTRVLLIDAQGATWFDLSDSSSTEIAAPSGGTFGEIAGGVPLIDENGVTYVVGATRTTTATSRVLVVTSDGALSFASLATARAGAAATVVAGRGVVVVGGSSDGQGAEVLAAGSTQGTPLPFPADPTVGAGAVPLDVTHVLVAGGGTGGTDAGTRVLDLACGASCAPTPWTAPLPFPISSVAFAALPARTNEWMMVAADSAGTTHALHFVNGAIREEPLRVGRTGATMLPLPTGGVAVLGGANEIESFLP